MQAKTILLVEDQIDFSAVQRANLERHGYHVLAVEDGLEAVRYAREHHPHVILMDLSLPSLDGLSATRELKRDPETSAIPVILLTAHAYGSVGRRAREAGCASFIPKPCEPRRVLEEVRELIGPAEEPVQTAIPDNRG
ncbi:MAG: response regulator [Gemmatimonas sp.]|nr:response regulator [Gemmatimonas sp.]